MLLIPHLVVRVDILSVCLCVVNLWVCTDFYSPSEEVDIASVYACSHYTCLFIGCTNHFPCEGAFLWSCGMPIFPVEADRCPGLLLQPCGILLNSLSWPRVGYVEGPGFRPPISEDVSDVLCDFLSPTADYTFDSVRAATAAVLLRRRIPWRYVC